MGTDNNTSDTLAEENVVIDELVSADGNETVSTVANEAISLKELKEILGKDFKDKATALKSVKDTFRYVGQKTIEPKIDESKFISKEQYEQDMFYSKNPHYDKPEIRTIVDSIAKTQGKHPREVVESDTFKAIFDKVRGYDESQNLKTVLATNPRLVASGDKLNQAAEAIKQGRKETAENLATKAVMEAYDL